MGGVAYDWSLKLELLALTEACCTPVDRLRGFLDRYGTSLSGPIFS